MSVIQFRGGRRKRDLIEVYQRGAECVGILVTIEGEKVEVCRCATLAEAESLAGSAAFKRGKTAVSVK